MIQYDPHHWRSHLFDIKGSMLREIFARIGICVVWSVLVVSWEYAGRPNIDGAEAGSTSYPFVSSDEVAINLREKYFPSTNNVFVQLARNYPVSIPLTGHTLIGAVIGLLLVFRTNASYDRFWEGRKLWGGVVNDSRNLGRLATSLLKEDADLLRRLLRWAMVFPWSVRYRLLGWKDIGCDTDDLPKSEVKPTEQAELVPLAVARRMTEQVEVARQRGLISDIQQSLFDALISRLIDALGACERIHNTPLPFAYMVHLRRALILFLMTMPLAIVKDFGWVTIPATLLISYVMLGVEEIGVEIEDPFGTDENDLPLKSICENIESNLRGLLPTSAET